MGIFGWSYPAGCSGPPDEDFPDDSVCCHCGQSFPDGFENDPDGWPYSGFCDAECTVLYHLGWASWSDDAPDGADRPGNTRAEFNKALGELLRRARTGKDGR